jgi:cyclopropane-fatty-acyl-phospholipid synthase
MEAAVTSNVVSSEFQQGAIANSADATIVIPPKVLASLQRGGLYELGESYMRGEWEVADLVQLMRHVFTQSPLIPVKHSKLGARFIRFLITDRLRNPQINQGAFDVARGHYDLGNDLFSAMLDRETITYTCGYWRNAKTLEQAQVAKIDLLCRKLHLRPGMRVLDIGCGWGNFAHYAAKNYGVKVVGLTVSKEQAALARQRCVDLDVEILLQDYRTFSGEFDRVVSIEMIEAVGRKNMAGFFDMAHRCLAQGGLFALQAISAETFSWSSSVTLDQYVLWLQKRIFPNGYLPNIRHLTKPSVSGLVIEDLHNFSYDYALTLKEWYERFESAWPQLAPAYGEPFRRMWRYYLQGCEALFRERMVQLYQIVYSKGGEPGGYVAAR